MLIIFSINKLETESEQEYIFRICSVKDEIGTWQTVADIINNALSCSHSESYYRKLYQRYKFTYHKIDDDSDTDNDLYKTLRFERRELEKERKRFQTEKLEYNRWLRENARDELIAEKIAEAIKETPIVRIPLPNEFERYSKRHKSSGKIGILCFGDEHFGTFFEVKGLYGHTINSYSPEIFFKRMWDLLAQTVDIVNKEQLGTICVYNMGDFSDGILRVSQLMKLRYGIIEGSVLYAKFIVNWLNELTKHVKVRFQMVKGNHTELRMLGQPKGTFNKENTDIIVREIIKLCLKDNPNFNYIENPTGYIYEIIYDKHILGIHGEVKNMEQSLKDFSNTYDVKIDYLIAGHLHHEESTVIGRDKEVIRVPSIIGIDDYSMSLNKTSNPGALFLVMQEGYGIKCKYPIKLN